MAAELVGGAFLSAAVQMLFQKIASSEIVDYFKGKRNCDFGGLLEKLEMKLSSATAVLDDAEQKQIRNRGVTDWLDKLQEAVYYTEDLLADIEADSLQLKMEASETSTGLSKVSNFFSSIFTSTDREMKCKLEKILDRLEYVASQKDVLGLKDGVGERPGRRLPSTSLMEESEVCGRDEEVDALIKVVLSCIDEGGSKIGVIPIVGMAGVAKTTLAQVVFNDERVKKHFELTAWVCVSQEFDVFSVTKTLIELDSPSSYQDTKDLNLLQIRLNEKLTGKKFLIVLDDVWNEKYSDWEAMRMPFKDGAQGSKIIVTMRSAEVASIVGTGTTPFHCLDVLAEEASLKLFAKHAIGKCDFTADLHFEQIGREIVKKCDRLPLAIQTLGDLLHYKSDIDDWEEIRDSAIWELSDKQSDILPALRLSYHYLPSHLKRCFAYCSIFPKGYEFQKEELVLLWMAENLLEEPSGNNRIEDVANQNFNDLLSRSFFQRSSTKNKSIFVIHDLIVDLANFVSGKYYFRLESRNSNEIVREKTRHFACVGNHEIFSKRFDSIFKATRVHTFLLLNFRCSTREISI